eukprot:CAMPEP_0202903478 /NCGR_PEP_ID=MMETSP1392-20130828/24638_1 /ASSEMBLY_ACC=CAM_ASM_000868 /TAXON_ID=225041 /ORGANISM="Chlamydomonas chlamydogama, Strain SAG 11-48b" /LENGTH=54 /DNA_ID=CAMNT_0049590679 /DNA_START=53 /DNA_END=213 /DNA_ORIENTATION=+
MSRSEHAFVQLLQAVLQHACQYKLCCNMHASTSCAATCMAYMGELLASAAASEP